MNSPFKYGQIVRGDEFTNREGKMKRLRDNLLSGINTILISPRKWGKSLLVQKTASMIKQSNNNYKFVF